MADEKMSSLLSGAPYSKPEPVAGGSIESSLSPPLDEKTTIILMGQKKSSNFDKGFDLSKISQLAL